MNVTKYEDGSLHGKLVVKDAGPLEQFGLDLLNQANGRWLTHDAETITITASNGTWKYRKLPERTFSGAWPRTVVAELIESPK